MRVLVTGGSGFIGSWIAARLRDEGHEVRALLREGASMPSTPDPADVEIRRGDIGDPNAIAKAAEDCDWLVHAAGLRQGTLAQLGATNAAGTDNVLNAARHAGVKRVVAISCADVTLTTRKRVNWSEDRVLTGRPLGDHALTMSQAEERVVGAGKPEFETVVLRPALVWGAGDSRAAALRDEGMARGLPIYGRGDAFIGTTHVENLAHCAVLALQTEGAAGSVFHVVDQEMNLSGDFHAELSRALGLPAPRTSWMPFALHRALAPADALVEIVRRSRSHSFDQQRAITQLGYEPQVSLSEGMGRLSQWVRETFDGRAAGS